jgi:two-component system cell cycle sensor histidine kinase/response regulator CckA
MPRMSGEETLQELKRIRSDVRVVLSSGYSEQEVIGKLEEDGVVGFVQKPYLISKLIAKVGEALAQ